MKKWDIIIIVILVVISFVPEAVFWAVSGRKPHTGTYAEITVDGRLYKNVPLSTHKGEETFTIKNKYGFNIVEVKDNKIRVIEADCPDKIDVKVGFVQNPGEMIVCLPHKLIIEIKGEVDHSDEILSY